MSNAKKTVGDEEHSMVASERRAQARAWALIAAVAAVAALLALRTHGEPPLIPQHVSMLWFVALFALCSALPLRFGYRGATMTVHLVSIPLVVGLFFLSPIALVTTRIATLGVVMAAHRRAPVKLAFNLVVTALSTETAVLLSRALLPDLRTIHLVSWVAAAAGEAADTLVTVLLFTVIVRVTTGFWQVRSTAGAGAFALAVGEVGGLLGITGAAAMQLDTGFSILVSMFVAILIVGLRLYHRLSERHAALDRLYAIARDLRPTAAEPSDVAPSLEQLRRLLHADSLELAVFGQSGDTATITRVSEPNERDGGVNIRYEVVPRSGVQQSSGLRPGSGILRRLTSVVMRSQGPSALTVPVATDDRELALLTAKQAEESAIRFTSGDFRVLEAAAAQLAAAIDRGRLVASLRHAATRDSLTDLANLDSLRTFLNTVLQDGAGAVLLLLNLDRFHEVNDTLGHEAGDAVLAEVAKRLQASPSQGGLAARLGADQFALAIPGQAGAEVARLAALAVKSRVDGSMRFDRVSADIRVTIGIARAPDHGSDATTLLRRAEMAMTAAKGGSTSIGEWEPSYEHDGSRRLQLLAGLRQAIAEGTLDLHFQPKLVLGSGEITGFEALARWTHPELGFISPAEFIPLAEASGLISALTSWVLRESLETCRAWHDMGKPVGIAVNISARSLDDPVLVGQVAAMLTACGLSSHWLTLEITESSVMENQTRALEILRQLRGLGVRLSIDDFGTGYSSLHQLRGLPVHEVKIDRSFVDCVDDGGVDRAVVRAIVDLCDSLGLTTVAEGVEKATQAVALESLGVPVVQGFFYSKPMPRHAATEWLSSRPTRPMVLD